MIASICICISVISIYNIYCLCVYKNKEFIIPDTTYVTGNNQQNNTKIHNIYVDVFGEKVSRVYEKNKTNILKYLGINTINNAKNNTEISDLIFNKINNNTPYIITLDDNNNNKSTFIKTDVTYNNIPVNIQVENNESRILLNNACYYVTCLHILFLFEEQ